MLNYWKTWLSEKLNLIARTLVAREDLDLSEYQHWLDTNPWVSHQGHLERIKLKKQLSSPGSNNAVFLADRWIVHGQSGIALSEISKIVIKFCIPYAPKVKNRHHLIDQVVAGFQDEVRINNLISSTNIEGVVPPLGGGYAGRLPYFKMEYVPGHSLDKEMRQDLDQEEFLKRLARLAYLANTISQLHHYRIVHHDLKPQNIMFCQSPGARQHNKLLLLDFGYANASLRDRVSRHDGQLSPVYMAPEQALLSQASLTRATDYFSFGVVAHEYLTGHALFPQSYQIFEEDGYRISSRYLEHLEGGGHNRIDRNLYPEVYDLIQRLTIFDSHTRLELCPSPFDVAYVFQHIAKKHGLQDDVNISYLDDQLDYYRRQQDEFESRSRTELALAYVEKVMVDVRKRSGQE